MNAITEAEDLIAWFFERAHHGKQIVPRMLTANTNHHQQEEMEGIVYWKSPSSKTHKHTASSYFLQATKFRAVNKRKGNLHIYAVDV